MNRLHYVALGITDSWPDVEELGTIVRGKVMHMASFNYLWQASTVTMECSRVLDSETEQKIKTVGG